VDELRLSERPIGSLPLTQAEAVVRHALPDSAA